MAVDYFCGHFKYGGQLEDLPEPHIRKFPNDAGVKQEVRFKITSYIGQCYDASHFYLRITETENPVWNEEDQCWQTCWNEERYYNGRCQELDFPCLNGAIRALQTWVADYEECGWEATFDTDDTLDEYIDTVTDIWAVIDRHFYREGD